MIKQESVENKWAAIQRRRSEAARSGWETRRRNLMIYKQNRAAERKAEDQDGQTRER